MSTAPENSAPERSHSRTPDAPARIYKVTLCPDGLASDTSVEVTIPATELRPTADGCLIARLPDCESWPGGGTFRIAAGSWRHFGRADDEVQAASAKPGKRRQRRRQIDFNFTDTGNASRFARDHDGRLAYASGLGWLEWDGRRWKETSKDEVALNYAKKSVRRMRLEAARIEDADRRKPLEGWAKKSERRGALEAMVALAKVGEADGPGLRRDREDFDASPYLLTCQNGTIDLRTGELRDSRPEDCLTRMTRIAYAPNEKAPRWRRFLREVFNGDEALIEYVRLAVGYSLTGEMREDSVFLPNGVGDNGKSVLMNTLDKLLGDYSWTAARETFLAGRPSGTVEYDLARMRGARLVAVKETEDGAKLARQLVKSISGRDPASARKPYQEPFNYLPTYKVWIMTNHLPSIPHSDYATWRRIKVIPFDVQFPKGDPRRDPQLERKLRKELPGILAWAVGGAREWYTRDGGLEEPRAVLEAVGAYRESQDTVGRFLSDETVPDQDAAVVGSELYEAYRAWATDAGLSTVSSKAFHKALDERGVERGKDKQGKRTRKGLRLEVAE